MTVEKPSVRQATGVLRRVLFWAVVAITILAAAYLLIAAPFIALFGEGYAWAAVVVPPLMILLVGAGIAWLIAVASARRRPRPGDDG